MANLLEENPTVIAAESDREKLFVYSGSYKGLLRKELWLAR